MDEAYQPQAPRRPERRAAQEPAIGRRLRWALIISGVLAAIGLLILFLVLRGWDAGEPAPPARARPAIEAGRVPVSPLGAYTVTGRVTLDQLPAEFFLAPVAGAVPEELQQKRDLVLDGATLVVGEQAANGRVRSLVANIVRLQHGARIITNGSSLEIMANQIVSDGGQVLGFEFVEAARGAGAPTAAAPAPRQRRRRGGQPEETPALSRPSTAPPELGTPGASGGTLRLVALTPLQGRLTVRLNGQDGALGEPGQAGLSGGGGGSSGDAIGDLLSAPSSGGGCGQGGQGGAGGDAGDGGVLELVGPITGSRDLIDFQADPGAPGRGGPGGPGACAGAGQGGPGANGEPGQAGHVLLRPEGA